MSEPTDPLPPETPEEALPSAEPKPLGCLANFGSLGLAMYAILVLGLLVSSLTCGVMTMVQTWRSQAIDSTELQSGVQTAPWRLSELRNWGVLQSEEVPALYHDHSPMADGSSGCLVMDNELVLWTDKSLTQSLAIPGAAIEDSSTNVRLTQGDKSIDCPFMPGDGADRLASMLRVDAARSPAPENPSDGE